MWKNEKTISFHDALFSVLTFSLQPADCIMEHALSLDLIAHPLSSGGELALSPSASTGNPLQHREPSKKLLELPPEIILHIISFLSSPFRAILAQTCHYFRDGPGYQTLHSAWKLYETVDFFLGLLRIDRMPPRRICMRCIRIRPLGDFQPNCSRHHCGDPCRWRIGACYKSPTLEACMRHGRFWITPNEYVRDEEITSILQRRYHTDETLSDLEPFKLHVRSEINGQTFGYNGPRIETRITLAELLVLPRCETFMGRRLFKRALRANLESGYLSRLLEKAEIFLCVHMSLNDPEIIEESKSKRMLEGIFSKGTFVERFGVCHGCSKEGAVTEFGFRVERSDDALTFKLILVRGVARDDLDTPRQHTHKSANWRLHMMSKNAFHEQREKWVLWENSVRAILHCETQTETLRPGFIKRTIKTLAQRTYQLFPKKLRRSIRRVLLEKYMKGLGMTEDEISEMWKDLDADGDIFEGDK